MTSILHTIAEHAKVRVEEAKKQKSLSEVKKEALAMEPLSGFPFEKALAEGDISFICERTDRRRFSLCGDRKRIRESRCILYFRTD